MKEIDKIQAVGNRLRLARRAKGLTQKDAADLIGIGISQYSKAEVGLRNLGSSALKLFCDKMGVSEDWVLNGSGVSGNGSTMYTPHKSTPMILAESGLSLGEDWYPRLLAVLKSERGQIEYAVRKLGIPLDEVLSAIAKRVAGK